MEVTPGGGFGNEAVTGWKLTDTGIWTVLRHRKGAAHGHDLFEFTSTADSGLRPGGCRLRTGFGWL
ncbi:MAG: hypothetical protein OEM97_05915 [Acidimicrobiia bacterium]|nr:hypothetical protein [Acidimicrobiia bacterium]